MAQIVHILANQGSIPVVTQMEYDNFAPPDDGSTALSSVVVPKGEYVILGACHGNGPYKVRIWQGAGNDHQGVPVGGQSADFYVISQPVVVDLPGSPGDFYFAAVAAPGTDGAVAGLVLVG